MLDNKDFRYGLLLKNGVGNFLYVCNCMSVDYIKIEKRKEELALRDDKVSGKRQHSAVQLYGIGESVVS